MSSDPCSANSGPLMTFLPCVGQSSMHSDIPGIFPSRVYHITGLEELQRIRDPASRFCWKFHPATSASSKLWKVSRSPSSIQGSMTSLAPLNTSIDGLPAMLPRYLGPSSGCSANKSATPHATSPPWLWPMDTNRESSSFGNALRAACKAYSASCAPAGDAMYWSIWQPNSTIYLRRGPRSRVPRRHTLREPKKIERGLLPRVPGVETEPKD